MDIDKKTIPPLPILAHADAIYSAIENHGSLILCAPPGTGKSTQVPKILLDRPGKILVLQPRRIAARNLALRVAEEMGEAVGETVGYQVRFESKVKTHTRIIYQTYGIFFQSLLSDPLLTGIGTILLDEFHERALEADATLAWLKFLRSTSRPDLKIVVMSATLEIEALKNYLPKTPLIEVEAETFPVEIFHQASINQEPVSTQAFRALKRLLGQGLSGSVLIFMPGQGDIRRTLEILDPLAREHGLGLFELHGSMEMEAQQRSLSAPKRGACIIVSTNVAETSLTIPGITAVIDSGLARIASYSSAREVNTLYLTTISQQNARQRAGRAGRTAPGICIKLWSADRDRSLPIALDPEILRVEPMSLVLSLHALTARYFELVGETTVVQDIEQSGKNSSDIFQWLTPPTPVLWEKSQQGLQRIGAIRKTETEAEAKRIPSDPSFHSQIWITPLGKSLAQFPTHPILARVLIDSKAIGLGELAAGMVAILESQGRKAKGPTLDLFLEGEDLAANPEGKHFDRDMRQSFQQLKRLVNSKEVGMKSSAKFDDKPLREKATQCWIIPYQDRIAMRQEKTQTFLLADGRKGVVEAGQIAGDAKLILVLELHETGGANQNRQVGIPVALPCEANWIAELFPSECNWVKVGGWDAAKSKVVQEEQWQFRGLILDRRPLKENDLDGDASEKVLVEKLLAGEISLPQMNEEAEQLILRIKLVTKHYPEYSLPALDEEDWALIYHEICAGKKSLRDLENVSVTQALRDYLGPALMAFVEKCTPVTYKLPGVRQGKFTYFEKSSPELAARLGDFIGLDGPMTLMEGKVDVVYDILAPNYRTVQKTSDLTPFWKNIYPEVKKELKRRYPKHPWP